MITFNGHGCKRLKLNEFNHEIILSFCLLKNNLNNYDTMRIS